MDDMPPTLLTLRALHLEVAQTSLLAAALRYRAELSRAMRAVADADALDAAADVLQRTVDQARAALSERGPELSRTFGDPKYLQQSIVDARRSALRVVEPPPKRRAAKPRKKGTPP